MRIAIDARELVGKPTGVGRYLLELLHAWRHLPSAAAHEFVLCGPAGLTVPFGAPSATSVITKPGTGTAWEQRQLPRLVRAAQADVLFSPAYSSPLWCDVPIVVTIHDVSFAAHPEWFSWREGTRRRVLARLSARRAARVLTLSEFSKREIVRHLGVPPERVDAIPLGVPRRGTPRSDARRASEARVLYVGTLFNRRHIPALIDGFARFAADRPGARLDIVGDNRTRPHVDVDGLIARSPAHQQVCSRAYVSDAELDGLYADASAFVFLSEYEGFGLTPLEALGAGVPIAVLDTPVAREVYRDAALYLERPDATLVAQALARLTGDAAERQRRLGSAQGLLGQYSWAACGQRTLDVLVQSATGRL